jgi:hypothetical protein
MDEYKIVRGVIKERRIEDGTAYYTVQYSLSTELSSKSLGFNIRHGFPNDPSGGNAVYDIGSSVFVAGIITPTGLQDGVILCAVRPRSGNSKTIESPLKPVYEKLKEDGGDSLGAEGLTPGDVFYKRGDGIFKFAYNGMYKILSKIGLGWIINPASDRMHGYANNLEFTFGNYGYMSSEVIPQTGEALFHFHFNSSASQIEPNASLITLDIGKIDSDQRVSFSVIDATDPTGELYKTKLKIDKNGKVEILAKDITLNISSDSGITNKAIVNIDENGNASVQTNSFNLKTKDGSGEINIDEEGNALVKTETLKLGKGTTNQNFIRGQALKTTINANNSALKFHTHALLPNGSIGPPIALTLKDLISGDELSNKHFLE